MAQEAVVALDDQVDRAVEQRMARGDVLGERSPFDGDEFLLEGHPLVAAEHRRAEADLAVATAKLRGHVGDLEAPRLALANRAAEKRERLR